MNTTLNIRQLVDQYLSEKDYSATTLKTYSYVLHYFWRYLAQQHRPATEPLRSDIIAYKRHMKESGLSSSTIDLYLVSLKGFFRWLAESNIYENIVGNVRIETRHKLFRKKILSPSQVTQLIRSISAGTLSGLRDRALINLIYTCGLRRIEAHRLSLSNVGKDCIYIQGKGHNDLLPVQVGSQAIDLIHDYLLMRTNHGEELSQKSPLFISHFSSPVNPRRLAANSISNIVKSRIQSAGLWEKGISVHSLRHSAAVSLIENGNTLYEVSIFLRHSSTDTARIYTRYVEEKLAAEKRPQNILQAGLNIT